eukprot:3201435-Pyramimonas_sp.AAC.1
MQQMVGYRGAMCQQYIHSSTKPCKFEFVVAPRTMFGVPRSGLVTGTGANQARERVTFWTAAPLKQAIGMTFERRTLTCIRNTVSLLSFSTSWGSCNLQREGRGGQEALV